MAAGSVAGVARCDPDGTFAVPVTTLTRDDVVFGAIAKLASEFEVIEVLVGHPVKLNGRLTCCGGRGPPLRGNSPWSSRCPSDLSTNA